MNTKNILLTGASSGIGFGITKNLIRTKHAVYGTFYKNEKRLKELKKRHPNQVHYEYADFSSPDFSAKTLIKNMVSVYKSINCIINCAGEVREIDILNITQRDFLRIFNINLFAPFFIVQECLKNKKLFNLESIINISSTSERYAWRGLLPYESSKAALSMMTRSLSYELSKQNIRVNAIAPGAIEVERCKQKKWSKAVSKVVPLGRPGLPSDIASLISFLISEQSSYITGQVFYVDGGLSTRL